LFLVEADTWRLLKKKEVRQIAIAGAEEQKQENVKVNFSNSNAYKFLNNSEILI